ncbi:MAG: GNAT family N-acetyltransferase, partial [Pseudomonadales bacterium]|nr:GNAT family N-acetyltransferase [Pseudomonadales bacterium]
SFEAYLSTFSSRKRKNLKKERQQVQDQNIRMHCFTGADITEAMWQQFYRFYQLTYAKRSGHGGYLNSDFFETIGTTLREHIVMVLAEHQGKYIAGALCFRDSTTLYGRYWGCIAEANFLHFEACYYQGIDFCIATGLQRFDPGAQGEHKIQRGFTPIYTYSNHWLVNPEFQTAVKQFLSEEQHHIQRYKSDAEALLPFKCTD